MNKNRRLLLSSMATLSGASMLPMAFAKSQSEAETWPKQSVQFIVPFPAGGGADTLARLFAAKLQETFGQTFIVENKAGAQGNIGVSYASRAAADGYTLLFAYAGTHAINPNVYRNLPFKESDFAPVVFLTNVPQLLVVHPSIPANNLQELIALAKASPDRLTYSSPGVGSVSHLAVELLKMMTSTQMLHVPYKGGNPSVNGVLAGEVSLTIGEPANMIEHVKVGRLRALAVTTTQRSDALPGIPTIAESGLPDYDVGSWNGVLVPKGTPRPIIDKLNAEINRLMTTPDVRKFLLDRSYQPGGGTPEAFGDHIHKEIAKWAKVVQAAGVPME